MKTHQFNTAQLLEYVAGNIENPNGTTVHAVRRSSGTRSTCFIDFDEETGMYEFEGDGFNREKLSSEKLMNMYPTCWWEVEEEEDDELYPYGWVMFTAIDGIVDTMEFKPLTEREARYEAVREIEHQMLTRSEAYKLTQDERDGFAQCMRDISTTKLMVSLPEHADNRTFDIYIRPILHREEPCQ